MRRRQFLLLGLLAACGRGASSRATAVVDSLVPRDLAIAQFQRGSATVTELAGGASSRDELVRRFVARLERRDTVELSSLALTRGEFGYLYYPTTPQSLPPYELSPDLMWFMLVQHGTKGLSRALEERGGQRLQLAGHDCEGGPGREGPNTVWGPCFVHLVGERGDTVRQRLFGLIIERSGHYKFVNLANALD